MEELIHELHSLPATESNLLRIKELLLDIVVQLNARLTSVEGQVVGNMTSKVAKTPPPAAPEVTADQPETKSEAQEQPKEKAASA